MLGRGPWCNSLAGAHQPPVSFLCSAQPSCRVQCPDQQLPSPPPAAGGGAEGGAGRAGSLSPSPASAAETLGLGPLSNLPPVGLNLPPHPPITHNEGSWTIASFDFHCFEKRKLKYIRNMNDLQELEQKLVGWVGQCNNRVAKLSRKFCDT